MQETCMAGQIFFLPLSFFKENLVLGIRKYVGPFTYITKDIWVFVCLKFEEKSEILHALDFIIFY